MLFTVSTHALVRDWHSIQGQDLQTNKPSKKLDSKKDVGVFYFISSQCPCSKSYFKYLNNLRKKYPMFNYMAFHVGKGVTKEKAQKYLSKFEIDYPVIMDSKFKYADMFGAVKTPHIFVVNKAGEVLFHGGAANSRSMRMAKKFYLDDALKEISKGKKPTLAHARALGCYIQR